MRRRSPGSLNPVDALQCVWATRREFNSQKDGLTTMSRADQTISAPQRSEQHVSGYPRSGAMQRHKSANYLRRYLNQLRKSQLSVAVTRWNKAECTPRFRRSHLVAYNQTVIQADPMKWQQGRQRYWKG